MGRIRRFGGAVAAVGATLAVVSGCAAPPAQTPQQQIDQIVQFVEAVRGHEFVTPPVVELLSDADFRAEVLANLDAAKPGVDADEVAFTALGWIQPGVSLWQQYQIAFGGGVVGFYDPISKELKVRGTDLTPYRREVIAHELTHALDDHLFDLNDIDSDGLIDEDYLAALVAIEGSASEVQRRYFDSMSDFERVQDLAEQLQLGSDPALLQVPITLLTLSSAPYLRGAVFQDELIAALGNPAGPDLSLTRYPETTEQAFDTTRFLADESAVAVPTPPAGGAAVRSGPFGQFMLTLLLKEGLALDAIDPVTVGWAGDAYVTWSNGTTDCLRLDTKMDTPAQATALAGALTTWSSRHAGATIEATAPDTVRLTSCAG